MVDAGRGFRVSKGKRPTRSRLRRESGVSSGEPVRLWCGVRILRRLYA